MFSVCRNVIASAIEVSERYGRYAKTPLQGGFTIRRILALTCLTLIAVAIAQTADAAARVALVIGNSAYQRLPRLAKPPSDAAAMANLLKRAGFEVRQATSLGFFAFKEAVRAFASDASEAEIAVIYFSGQGMGFDGVNYLLPIDARLTIEDDAAREGIDLDSVISAVMRAKQLGLVILDASYARALVEIGSYPSRTIAGNAGERAANALPENVMVASATKAGATAKDAAGGNSPYAAALLKHLGQPGLDVSLAFARVRDDVLKATGNKQEPVLYGSLDGRTIALIPAAN
jgi:uncharacterized caspase-like protein